VYDGVSLNLVERNQQLSVYPQSQIKTFPPYFINPSRSESLPDYSFNESATIGTSLATRDLVIDERSAFGTFIHQVMCSAHAQMSEKEIKALITRLSASYEVPLKDFETGLAKQVHGFFQWIETAYHPQRIYKELPMMMQRDGQFINGIADLVIETKERLVLIDYKTFSGNEESLRWKASTFSGQLNIYSEILSKYFSGKKVVAGIYFVLEGKIVWMSERPAILA
jgi:ATP-dependent exoDNAse (exonuclease V) beta subunit